MSAAFAGMVPAAPQSVTAAGVSFAPAVNYGIGAYPASVIARDFNEDGRPDLAVSNAAGGNVSILLGNGNGTFQNSLFFSTEVGPFCLASGDFNGDGHLDL